MANAIINNKNPLYYALKKDFKYAKSIKILVSFLRESGAKLIVPLLNKVPETCSIIIITSRYLNITDPSALFLLKHELGDKVTLKFYNNNVISFHPKVYIIEKENENSMYIGSSNISKAALLDGIEWNYRLDRVLDEESYVQFSNEFDEIQKNLSVRATDKIIREYKKDWKKNRISKNIDLVEEKIVFSQNDYNKIQPKGAQIEALYELENARKEGVEKGIVVAATGVGKTYLSIFDCENFDKVLFVAHRKEILVQAKKSFEKIYGDTKTYGYFNGEKKSIDKDIIFASNQALGKSDYLTNKYFHKQYFDYIIVDEFHHAVADTYRRIIDYFTPNFLLGLTATPYRMDAQDIFKLCNDNLIYELTIREAINREMLVPFNYYALYDSTDYTSIKWVNGGYDKKELERKLSTHKRVDLIMNQYNNLGGKKTLAFCAGIEHAEYMAKSFYEAGFNVATVHSNKNHIGFRMNRAEAIKKIKEGVLDILFTVDMFNEGVDIPSIDTVMFLRPTESYVIFLQQLGRGLRLSSEKDRLIILDFIGNYKRAHFVPKLLAGENLYESKKKSSQIDTFEYPKDCSVQFDFRIINLFKNLEKKDPIRKQMREEYFRLKTLLNKRPLRLDIFESSDINIKEYILKSRRGYNGYLEFLKEMNELSIVEKSWFGNEVFNFILEIEKTRMYKSYKIPVLMTFLGKERLKEKVSLDVIGKSFRRYYRNYEIHQKDLMNKRHKNWKTWSLDRFKKEALKNPIKFLNKSEFFFYDEVNKEFRISEKIIRHNSIELKKHFEDIVNYRSINYFARRY